MGAHINFGFPPDGIRYNQLYDSGSLLYNLIIISSGEGSATITGQILLDKINSLSGFVTGVSGYLQNQIIEASSDVNQINGLTGSVSLVGIRNVDVSLSGQTIFISGKDWISTGQADARYYPLNSNPSGYLINQDLLSTSGALTGRIYQTGLDLYNQLHNTGQLLFNRDAAISGGLEVRITATGNSAVAHANGVGTNLSGNLAQTGATLLAADLSLSGALTGRIYQTGLDLYNQLYNTGQLLFNRDAAISGGLEVRITATGNSAIAHANGVGINLSGNLQQTGSNLQNQINLLSQGTGNILQNVVFTTGTQFISGTKYFIGNTFIDNLFVTGTQTVIHSQDFYVSDNWIVMNATGGARDSAIFVSTGITGFSATGGVLGFDVPSNTWRFGLASQQTDLISLPRIASGEAVDLVDAKVNSLSGFVLLTSGGLEIRITASGNSSVNHANGIGINLSGNLSQTGSVLWQRDLDISGALRTLITQADADVNSINGQSGTLLIGGTGGLTVLSGGQGLILISGDQSISGYIVSVSGGLEQRIFATGAAAVAHANSIGQTISGNLTLTGQTLNNAINTGLAWVNNLFVHRTGDELITGTKTFLSELRFNSGLKTPERFFGSTNYSLVSGDYVVVATGAVANVTGVVPSNLNGEYSGVLLTIINARTISLPISGVIGPDTNPTIFPNDAIQIYGGSGVWHYIRQTGSPIWTDSDNNSRNLSGNLTLTGQALFNRDALISGGLEARITATGNAAVAHANSIGQTISGNLTLTGQTLQGRIDSLSGTVEGQFVHRTGAELISGQKNFTSSPLLENNLAYQIRDSLGTARSIINLDSSDNVSVAGRPGVTDININGSTALIVKSAGAVGIGTASPQQKLHVSGGNVRYDNHLFSGTTNIADIFATQTALTQTGVTLGAKIDSASGYAENIYVHRTGNEFISGNKTFLGLIDAEAGAEISGASVGAIPLQVSIRDNNEPAISAIFSKGNGTGYGSTVLRVARNYGSTSTGYGLASVTDIEQNSAGSGPFRYGTYTDTVISNSAMATNGVYGSIHFATSGEVQMTIAGGTLSRNVGIRNQNPQTQLHVQGGVTGIVFTGQRFVVSQGSEGYFSGSTNLADIFATLTALTLTGQTLFNRDDSISGALEARITATGNSAVAHANGIGINLSGNLTLTGQTLNNAINTGLAWVNGVFVHRTGEELVSGRKWFEPIFIQTGFDVNVGRNTNIGFSGASGVYFGINVIDKNLPNTGYDSVIGQKNTLLLGGIGAFGEVSILGQFNTVNYTGSLTNVNTRINVFGRSNAVRIRSGVADGTTIFLHGNSNTLDAITGTEDGLQAFRRGSSYQLGSNNTILLTEASRDDTTNGILQIGNSNTFQNFARNGFCPLLVNQIGLSNTTRYDSGVSAQAGAEMYSLGAGNSILPRTGTTIGAVYIFGRSNSFIPISGTQSNNLFVMGLDNLVSGHEQSPGSRLTVVGQGIFTRDMSGVIVGIGDSQLKIISGSGLFTSHTGTWARSGLASIEQLVSVSGNSNSQIVATGNAAVAHANSIGQTISGNLTTTGQTLDNKINSLSGYSDGIFVHRTGQEIISGVKFFNNNVTFLSTGSQGGANVIVGGIENQGAVLRVGFSGSNTIDVNGSVLFHRWHTDPAGANRFYLSSNVGNNFGIAGNDGGGLKFQDSAGNSGVYYIRNGGHPTIRAGTGDGITVLGPNGFVGVGILTPLQRLHVSGGNIRYEDNIFSGTQNLADLLYPRSNPSGYVTDFSLYLTGSILDNKINSLSGWSAPAAANYVYRTGDQSITGLKTFVQRISVGENVGVGTGYFGNGGWRNNPAGDPLSLYLGHNPYFPNATFNTSDLGLIYSVSDTGTTPSKPGLVLYNNDTGYNGWAPLMVFAKAEAGSSNYKAGLAAIGAHTVSGSASSTDWIDGNLVFYVGKWANAGLVPVMRINSSGFIGIGTDPNPVTPLHVSGGFVRSDVGYLSGATNIADIFATLTALTLTGQTLFNRDASISGGLEARITATGNAAVTHANGIGVNLSGNLSQTGSTLWQRDLSISGALSAVRVSGSNVINNVDLTGLGGTLVFWSGAQVFISGGAGGGGISQGQLDSLSGWTDAFFVHRTGNELISGNKNWLDGQYDRQKTISANYTVLSSDCRLYCNNSASMTLTFPSLANASGQNLKLKLINTGVVTLTGTFGQKFDGQDSYQLFGQYTTREIHGADGTNWYLW